ncbi:phosphoglycerate dehydrogenase-like enzyme [Murinocardiopsis flavida]|uniref:Phosphoglycerate dehydrogenase-like enzyme n=1 Tax=Murinocardiopsis flavida TaxID=645275 RepID=A0A2P8DUL5_9ACTN|nr:D-2-hydroxyacid dehydrogenase [Murinocardiopsis flavida]PSL00903.1 phosphoglycerate dehydrogenase-like enzyme [Murinocardiopsis flavida]
MAPLTLAVAVEDTRPDLSAIAAGADVAIRYATPAELPDAIDGADALLVWAFTAGGVADAWPRAAALRWMHVSSAGVDRVLTPQVVASDVVVTNVRGVLDDAIAEYVLGLVLAFAKDLPGTLRRQGERRWEHRPTERLRGARALVVGPGAIGRAIGSLLGGVGMGVDAVARSRRDGDATFAAVHGQADLGAVIGDYHYVIVAAPLTDGTRGMLDAGAIAAMAPDARLINVARGPIVDEEALTAALLRGDIAGAALDVFHDEPLPAEHPLWRCPNVIISPHMAGDFVGWRDSLLGVFLDNFARFRSGRPLLNVVRKELGFVV